MLSGILPWLPTDLAFAGPKRPNILVIMGDDIGWFNLSAYNRGMMGYRTPHIDSLAKEGIMFTDFYGEQSCTAGRAAFITGQATIRTGMTKVGVPGVDIGLQKEDPTLAELLKPLGYRTGQFGKNHLGDLDKYLPTVHGFDEFYGNLYHLNAEEEPENEDYLPEGESIVFDQYRPRGVLHSYAGQDSHQCEEGKAWEGGPFIEDVTDKKPRRNPTGNQRVCDTGPLTIKRMETIDGEVLDHTKEFIADAKEADEPFFVWFNTTRMHVFTHLKEESQGVTGQGIEG
ncbi:MAG: sulfatase-like hydrolase/transferase, partial [Crocosphaera sp.]